MMPPVVTPEGDIVIFPHRGKLVLVLLGAVGFVAIGIFLLWYRNVGAFRRVEFVLTGLASILFFGLVAVYVVYRLVWRRPAVIIGPGGIVDHSSLLGVGRLQWSEVAYIEAYRFRNQPMLGVYPRDLDAVLARLPGWHRRAIRMNLSLGCAPMNLPQVTLPGRIDDLARLIASRFDVEVRL